MRPDDQTGTRPRLHELASPRGHVLLGDAGGLDPLSRISGPGVRNRLHRRHSRRGRLPPGGRARAGADHAARSGLRGRRRPAFRHRARRAHPDRAARRHGQVRAQQPGVRRAAHQGFGGGDAPDRVRGPADRRGADRAGRSRDAHCARRNLPLRDVPVRMEVFRRRGRRPVPRRGDHPRCLFRAGARSST